jgi:hypothetical protein
MAKKLHWNQISDTCWASEPLTDPNIVDREGVTVPFIIAVECLDWAETIGVGELHPAERRYYDKHGAIWISALHIIPELPPGKVKNLDVGDAQFPWYAEDAARYGYGCPVMPPNAVPGTSCWTSKSCPDAESAARIAMRYAENKVLPDLEDVLGRPVNRMGELAENWLGNSIDPDR